MKSEFLVISPALFIFSLCIALFALIIANGYALNFLSLPANAWLIWLDVAPYWLTKSLFLLNLPVALFAVIPFARAIEFAQQFSRRQIFSSAAAFATTALMLATLLLILHPPPRSSPLTEAESQCHVLRP